MSEVSQAPLPISGVDVPERLCPKCGKPMAIKRIRVPEGTKRKNWRWVCQPCTNARARITHQSPHRQAAKQAYREKHAEKIAARKSEWAKEDRAQNPEKYQARARIDHERLMADPERKRRKYDKANERDRLALVELKKDPEAYEEYREKDRVRCQEKYSRLRTRLLHQGKKSHYWSKYGITLEQLSALYKAQEGKCACCEVDLPNPATTKTKHGRGQWHLDHCHETGVIRGLLCHRCNMGLGMFKDSSLRLQQAIRYLNGGNADLVASVLYGADEGAAVSGASHAGSDADSAVSG